MSTRRTLEATLIAAVFTLVSASIPSAQEQASVGGFLTPNGRVDMGKVRESGFQGSLNMEGFSACIDSVTGDPVFLAGKAATTETSIPDDVYWSSMPGMNNFVHALAVYDGKLIAGGDFTIAGGDSVNHVAAWDGTSWSPLGLGVNNVLALTVYDRKLIAGGYNTLSSWDGTSWSTFGTGADGTVNTLTVFGNKLIVGGCFSAVDGVSAKGVAAWDGTLWSALGSGIEIGAFGGVYALTVYNDKLVAGGCFEFALGNGDTARCVATWDGASWSALGSGMGTLLGGLVEALTVYDGKLIAGGWWTEWKAGVPASNIAAWDGSSWSALGSGLSGLEQEDTSCVFDLVVYDGKLFVGGGFRVAGGDTVNYVASWDGSSWSALGSGVFGYYRWVYALAEYDNKLFVGGAFATAGGDTSKYITCWTKTDSIGVVQDTTLPLALKIYPNVPNPFNPSTTLRFETARTDDVRVVIYNVLGQEVCVLKDGVLDAGAHSLVWDGRNTTGKMSASGAYFYVIKAGGSIAKGKVMFLR